MQALLIFSTFIFTTFYKNINSVILKYLTHGKLLVGPNTSYLGLQSEASRLITSKDNPIIYEENGTVPPFEGFTADDSKLLEGHPASYFATSDHTHSQYALTTHAHTEYAPNVHNHTMDQLTGVLSVEKGGTGVTSVNAIKLLLGINASTEVAYFCNRWYTYENNDTYTFTFNKNVKYVCITGCIVDANSFTYNAIIIGVNSGVNSSYDITGPVNLIVPNLTNPQTASYKIFKQRTTNERLNLYAHDADAIGEVTITGKKLIVTIFDRLTYTSMSGIAII